MAYFKDSVLFFSILFLKDLQLFDSLPNNVDYNNTYGDDYGTEWIYFPDGDGTPIYVNLSIPKDENTPLIRGLMNNEIEYRLYTRNSTENYVILNELAKPIDDGIDLQSILSCKPLKMITHGWLSSADSDSVLSLKNAYLEAQDVNVITVDWSGIAGSIFYHWVANDTKLVGARIGSFLNGLQHNYNVYGKQVHLIGHSLGAHIVGIAASNANFTVDRITENGLSKAFSRPGLRELRTIADQFTGLDPARPLFEYPSQDNSAKLDSSDADFVDVIHTCGGVLGFVAAIGTVDFYPNNGIAPQPGCDSLQKIFEACSHGRAYYYFEESIKNPSAFPSFQCQSWEEFLKNKCDHYTVMGDSVYKNISGKFYLRTNSFRPFGLRT